MGMGFLRSAVACVLVALVLPAPAAALGISTVAEPVASLLPAVPTYVYVPGAVTVATSGSADAWLDNAELAYGVDSQAASDDPLYATNPDLKYVDRSAKVMQKHWERLDATCDPDAVFALMYLWTTYTVRDHIAQGFFDDNRQLSIVTVAFVQLYFDAYHSWHGGTKADAPAPWQEAFRAAEEHRTSVLEDEFLGMNGHINYDLAIAMWQTGIDDSRKPDHDRINRVLLAAAVPVGEHMAAEYGSAGANTGGADPNDPLMHHVMWPIYDWREAAWWNAVRLRDAPDDAARELVKAEMELHGFTVAQAFQTPKQDGDWDARIALCEASNAAD